MQMALVFLGSIILLDSIPSSITQFTSVNLSGHTGKALMTLASKFLPSQYKAKA